MTEVRRKVMVIDDDSRYLDLLRFMLEEEGYDVVTESNSGIAADRIVTEAPDVVVTDIMMPTVDGVKLGRLLKLDDRTFHVPVVYVSAWTGRHEQAIPPGAARLFKPFTPRELMQAIERALADAPAQAHEDSGDK